VREARWKCKWHAKKSHVSSFQSSQRERIQSSQHHHFLLRLQLFHQKEVLVYLSAAYPRRLISINYFDDDPYSHSQKMPLTGAYKLIKSENFEEYMKAVGKFLSKSITIQCQRAGIQYGGVGAKVLSVLFVCSLIV
jgi:hypothetical protein